jgi:hypothetical protein
MGSSTIRYILRKIIMKKLLVAILAAISFSAFASGPSFGGTTNVVASPVANATAVGQGGNAFAVGTGGNAYAGNYTEVYNKAIADQQQKQAQGQSQQQANSQNMTYNQSPEVHYSGKYTVKSTPDVSAPPAYATSPCRIALSGGVSVIGLGLSAGGSVEDEGCTLRENARILNSLGANNAALRLMCNDAKVAAVLTDVCEVK